jgi:uncharacterized membrane protein
VAALLMLLIAFAIRVWTLDLRSLWFDEAMEYWVATAPLTDLWLSVRSGIQDPPLYSLLLHAWRTFGEHEFQLRYLSVAASSLSIALAMQLGQRTLTPAAGLFMGAILALMPADIRYAQEVGQYALMGSLLMGATLTLPTFRERTHEHRPWSWLWWAVAATYSYYGAIFTCVIPLGLRFLQGVLTRQWRVALQVGTMAVGYLLLITPLVLFFLPYQLRRGPTVNALQGTLFPLATELSLFLRSTQDLLLFPFTGWPWTPWPRLIPTLLLLVLFGCAIALAVVQPAIRQRWADLGVTLFLYYLASRFQLFPYGFRYGLILVPLILLLLGAGLAGVQQFLGRGSRGRIVAGVLCASLLVIEVAALPHPTIRAALAPHLLSSPWPETEDLRPLVATWQRQRQPDHWTYVYYGASPGFRYYLRQLGVEQASIPATWYLDCWRSMTPAYCQIDGLSFGLGLRSLSATEKVQQLAGLPVDQPGGWLVFSHVVADDQTLLTQEMQNQYARVETFQAPGATLYFYQKEQ